MTRAAVYARISRDPDEVKAGVERQAEDGLAAVKREGWTLVADGTPYLAIAATLGITKNQAIGKAKRMKFERAPAAPQTPKQTARALANETRTYQPRVKSPSAHDFPPHTECVWPTGDPPALTFCRAPVAQDGKPYCPAHMRRAYGRPEPS